MSSRFSIHYIHFIIVHVACPSPGKRKFILHPLAAMQYKLLDVVEAIVSLEHVLFDGHDINGRFL